jgi:hypothetical protein
LAGAAATIVTDATANAATADATTKASADKHDDSGSATGAAAAPTGAGVSACMGGVASDFVERAEGRRRAGATG